MPGPMMGGPGGRRMAGRQPGQKVSFDVLKRLAAYVLQNYKIHCLVVLVCIVVTSVTTLCATLFMKSLIDDYITPMLLAAVPDYGPLANALTRLVAALSVGILCSYGNTRIMAVVSQGTMKRLRTRLFSNMESLPIRYFDTHPHGDIMSVYTNDVDTLRQVIGQSFPNLVNSAVSLVGTFVSMVVLNLPLTMVSVFMVCVMLFVTSRLSGLSMGYFVRQQKNLGAVNGYIEEMSRKSRNSCRRNRNHRSRKRRSEPFDVHRKSLPLLLLYLSRDPDVLIA